MSPALRVGVLGSEKSWYTGQLSAAVSAAGHAACVLDFELLLTEVTARRLMVRCGEVELTALDALIVRMMPPGSLEEVVVRMDILRLVEESGVLVLNPPVAVECAVDKLLTTARLAKAGLPVPATVTCESTEDAMAGFERLGRDVVVKPLFGSEGRGMLRLSDPDLAFRTFRTLERTDSIIYLQKYISAGHRDLRILLLADEIIGSMRRQGSVDNFRANVAQFGSAASVVPDDADIHLARQAMSATGCIFGGVDIIHDSEHNPWLLEVNAVPGWRALQRVCDVHVAERVVDWITKQRSR